jgi:hypothetical protein
MANMDNYGSIGDSGGSGARTLLEDRAHRMIVDAGRREVDLGIEELVDERADCVGLGERRKLIAKLEVVENVLDVGREASRSLGAAT